MRSCTCQRCHPYDRGSCLSSHPYIFPAVQALDTTGYSKGTGDESLMRVQLSRLTAPPGGASGALPRVVFFLGFLYWCIYLT
jgi:hypothetical protein